MTARSASPRLWFLSPVVISLLVAAAALTPTALIGDTEFREMWGTPKSITGHTILLFACAAVALAFGAQLAIAVISPARPTATWPAFDPRTFDLLRRAGSVLTALTLFGYAGFVFLMARAGLTPGKLLSSDPSYSSGPSIREMVGTVPGVTTMTQCGMAAVVVCSLVLAQRFSRADLAKVVAVIGLAVPRAYLFSERLAILEVVVPVVVIFCARMATAGGRKRLAVQFTPLFGLPLLAVLFGFFEYFRSWNYYRTRTSKGFVEFTLDRLAGYYTTAMNNGHLILTHLGWPGRVPFDTLEAFWAAPGIENFELYFRLTGRPMPYPGRDGEVSPVAELFAKFGNPEFNNTGGYTAPFIDYGTVGGLIFFFAIGLLSGALYLGFVNGKPFGLLLYPIIFVGLLELPRYMHWSQGRTTYTWLALIIVASLMRRAQKTVRGSATTVRDRDGTDLVAVSRR